MCNQGTCWRGRFLTLPFPCVQDDTALADTAGQKDLLSQSCHSAKAAGSFRMCCGTIPSQHQGATEYTGYCTAAAHTIKLQRCQSSKQLGNPLDFWVGHKGLLEQILSGCVLVERTSPNPLGEAGSVGCPKLPPCGLRQRSRTCFLVRVSQGGVEWKWQLTNRHPHSSRRQMGRVGTPSDVLDRDAVSLGQRVVLVIFSWVF